MDESYHVPDSPATKTCSRCHIEKSAKAFSKNNQSKSGLQSQCRACHALQKPKYHDITQLSLLEKRICTKCQVEKDMSEFYVNRCSPSGRSSECKSCSLLRYQKTLHDNPDYIRHKNRRNKLKTCYNLTYEEYHAMLEAQDGVCMICQNPQKGSNQYGEKRLFVDHDHTTGKVRGLLCQTCNMRLSVLENEEFVTAGQAYLERYK